MAKSQINNLSKRQILESLMYEQNQSNATLSRLITAAARTAGVDPEKLAEMFTEDKENQDYVEKFNAAVKAIHAKRAAAENLEPKVTAEDAAKTETNDESTNA